MDAQPSRPSPPDVLPDVTITERLDAVCEYMFTCFFMAVKMELILAVTRGQEQTVSDILDAAKEDLDILLQYVGPFESESLEDVYRLFAAYQTAFPRERLSPVDNPEKT